MQTEYAVVIVSNKEVLLDHDFAKSLHDAVMWVSSHGYVRAYFKRRQEFYVHRFVMGLPAGKVIDHINGNKLDNRRSNLRICRQRDNVLNSRRRTDNKSAIPGVYWATRRQKWAAQINVDGRMVALGRFVSKDEAKQARLEAERKYHGEFARSSGVMK